MTRPTLLLTTLAVAACSAGVQPSSEPGPKTGDRVTGAERSAGTPPTRGGAILYRPVSGSSYALERRDSLTLELPGGGNQVQQFARTAYVTVAIAEAAGGYRTTIRLDSLRQEAGGTVSADSVLRAEGTTWSGTLTPQGRLGELRADRTSVVADQVGSSLGVLFPVLPVAGLQEAASWTDTTERALRTDAFDAKERAVTSYRVLKVENRIYTIDAATAFQRTGNGGQATQPMEMTSQGTRKSLYRFGAEGAVVGAEGADSAEMTITVPAVGQTVPVHQRASWKISKK